MINDRPVAALAVEDKEFAGGQLAESTLDYFAQDDDGNVYYLGEDVNEYKNSVVSGHGGAWLYGKDTQKLGLLRCGASGVGDRFRSEDAAPITWESDEVVSLTDTKTVSVGTFQNCLKIKERASDGGTEYKLYALGVGCIVEDDSDGELSLKTHGTN